VPAWLLHINVGYPLLEPGVSRYCYNGTITPRAGDEAFFAGPEQDFRQAPAEPLDAHRGPGEAFTYIDPEPDADGLVTCGVVNDKREVGLMITYSANDYPRLGNWQHWGPRGSFVGALEPMNCGVEGRDVDRARGHLAFLEPGETREYRCTIKATDDPTELDTLRQINR